MRPEGTYLTFDLLPENAYHLQCSVFRSGVFRISVRKGRGAVSVEGSGCGGGAAPQRIILSPKWWVWVHSAAVFNRQKTRTVTKKPWDADFTVQAWNEALKTVQK